MFPKKVQGEKSKDDFLHNLDEAREARRREKQNQQAAIIIQKTFRGFRVRKKYRNYRKNELNSVFLVFADSNRSKSLPLASTMFNNLKNFVQFYQRSKNEQNSSEMKKLFSAVLNYLLSSLVADEIKFCHLAGFFNKDFNSDWIKLNQDLMLISIKFLESIDLSTNEEIQLLLNALKFLDLITEFSSWKSFQTNSNELLQKAMIALNCSFLRFLSQQNIFKTLKISLIRSMQKRIESSIYSTVLNLSFKILLNTDLNRTQLVFFSQTMLTVPNVINFSHESSNKFFQTIFSKDLFNRLICLFSVDESCFNVTENLDAVEICYLLGNLISIGTIDQTQIESMKQPFVDSLFNLFESIRKSQNSNEKNKKQNPMTSFWHPILGHVKGKTGTTTASNSELIQRVIVQIKFLCSKTFVNFLFESIPSTNSSASSSSTTQKKEISVIRAKFEKLFSLKTTTEKFGSDELTQSICRIATFYQKFIQTLTELKLQVLCALSLQDSLISSLWQFLYKIGPNCGLKELFKLYESQKEIQHPIFDLLELFSNLCSYLITVLDEEEMYKEEKFLRLESWSQLGFFLNNFLYRIIRFEFDRSQNGKIQLENNSFYKTLHQLLILLHERNSRKSFTDESHWLIKELKCSSTFFNDLERDDPCSLFLLDQIPHIFTFKDRVKILQMFIERDKEKESNEISLVRQHQKNYLEIHRSNIFSDAFESLHRAPITIWKNTIRICFINQQGLSEAGIDQNGIFKEFIQQLSKQAFDPSFNLFKLTENGTLFPSPISDRTENFLLLFNFIGKILGKAVYEQIVLDVELAPFFLRHLLTRRNINYSCFDDLMFLDRDLYNNLNFVKHYKGDVSELGLTYSIDEDILGEIVTSDIIPCGRHINVTNDDKIIYVHRMSVYRTFTRIKHQIKMFADGFKSLMKPEWINMFSVNEVQQLISGESSDIDLEDLKANIVYQGGYHRTHPVIKWLWQILEQDFNREERTLFLRFVTSSARAPLLGFRSLNPPFTIRCLESSEHEDEGDSLGRIFRTMISIHRTSSERLPSSSTCFNLLKLPNYKTRKILLEKLRYAIKANAGFELS